MTEVKETKITFVKEDDQYIIFLDKFPNVMAVASNVPDGIIALGNILKTFFKQEKIEL